MNNNRQFKKIAVIVLSIGLITGGVYAGFNYEKISKYVIGGGIEKAAENGYIENVDMDYIKQETLVKQNDGITLNNIDAEFKVNDFTMDDTNLCMNYTFTFDEKIKEYIDLSKIHKFLLKDLTIVDENNIVLFDKSYGVNTVKTRIDISENSVDILYNMFGNDKYPKSKKLILKFSEIDLTEYNESLDFENEKSVSLKGNWQIELDVPEKMYNRTSYSYKVINTSNENFKAHTALLTETGFEFGAIIENCEDTYNKIDISKIAEEYGSLYKSIKNNNSVNDEEMNLLIKKYRNYEDMLHVISFFRLDMNTKKRMTTSYIRNSNEEEFKLDETPGKTQKYEFIGDDVYDFTITFEMTKNEATDDLTVVLDYRGEIVTIELQKV